MSIASADAVVAEITAAGGRAVANGDDISSASGAGRLVEQALEAFGGRLDIVVNNAGTAQPTSFLAMTATPAGRC